MRQLRSILGWMAVVVLSLSFTPAARADAFSGGWQVHCTPTTTTAALGGDAFDDGFLFEQDSHFSAQAFAAMGFTPGDYTVDSTGKMVCTLTSSDRGSVRWYARISAGTISGGITWTKPDGSIFKYTYTGTAAVADASAGD